MRAALLLFEGSNQSTELGTYFLNSLRQILCKVLLDISDPLGDHEMSLQFARRSLRYVQTPDKFRDCLSFLPFCNVGRYRDHGSSELVSEAEILVKSPFFEQCIPLPPMRLPPAKLQDPQNE